MITPLLLQNVCSTLWCTVGTTCHSKLDGAVDGTSCGEAKVSLPFHMYERRELCDVVRKLILFPRGGVWALKGRALVHGYLSCFQYENMF